MIGFLSPYKRKKGNRHLSEMPTNLDLHKSVMVIDKMSGNAPITNSKKKQMYIIKAPSKGWMVSLNCLQNSRHYEFPSTLPSKTQPQLPTKVLSYVFREKSSITQGPHATCAAHCSTFFTKPHRPLRHLSRCFFWKTDVRDSCLGLRTYEINWPTDLTWAF